MHFRIRIGAASLLTFGFAALSTAQDTPSATPLRAAFDAAWARQPEQRAAALRQEASAAQLDAARRLTPAPASLGVSGLSERPGPRVGRREFEVGVSVPLWLRGERAGVEAAALADAEAVDAKRQATRWRIAGEVREAYWALRRAAIESELAARRLDSARALAADVGRRVRAGDLARADANLADGSVAAATSAVAEADIARARAIQRWTALTGGTDASGPGDDRASSERVPEVPPDAAPDAVDRVGTDAHPALYEQRTRVAAAERQRELARLQSHANPEVSLTAIRERDTRGERTQQSLTLGLRIPLGRLTTYAPRLATAAADAAEAEAQLALDTQRVRGEITAGAARLQGARAGRIAADERSRLATETRGFFERSFRAGETDLPARFRVEIEAVEAARLAARARVDEAAAVSQWRQALGLLPE